MKQIGLIDVDGHNFPNLALMKLSAWHKGRGDSVEWWNGLKHYDRVYQSKVFTFSKDNQYVVMADEVVKGGTGYCIHGTLPTEVEHATPDYGLYGIDNTAYGFLTRGCPRGCGFCIVKEKEGGRAKQVAELGEFWNGQNNIILLDPNITAARECEKLFDTLIDSKAWIDFSQGLDVRLLTDKSVDQLNRMKLKRLHFAWDNYEPKTFMKLKEIRPLLNYDRRRLVVYVLTNFNTTHQQDITRVMMLREIGYDPFIMVYNKPNAPKITKRLQRWVNNKRIFWATESFSDYQKGVAT